MYTLEGTFSLKTKLQHTWRCLEIVNAECTIYVFEANPLIEVESETELMPRHTLSYQNKTAYYLY